VWIREKRAHRRVVLSFAEGLRRYRNPLYEMPNCSMLFGDAKASVEALTAAVKAL
jgi:NAD/NADP transhydrogenase beta subunit